MIMLHLYAADSADFIYLMHHTGLSRGNLSSHMSKLEEAGYLTIEKKFVDKVPCTMLTLTEKGRLAFKEYKDTMTDILSQID
jgi:DNA-binding MarR family transcriptional regulator